MIERMEKLFIYSMKDQTDAVMEAVLRCGVIQPMQTQSEVPDDMSQYLNECQIPDISHEENFLSRIEQGISSLKKYGMGRSIFGRRPVMAYHELTRYEIISDGIEICDRIEKAESRIAGLKSRLSKAVFTEASLLPWESFDMPVEKCKTAVTDTAFYIFRGKQMPDNIDMALAENGIAAYRETVCQDEETFYTAVMFHRKNESTVRETVEQAGATLFSVKDMKGTFAENIEKCRREIKSVTEELDIREKELAGISREMKALEKASDALKVRIQNMSGREDFLSTEKVNIITGWIPESKKGAVSTMLSEYNCFCRYEKPAPDEEYPVLMKNSKLVKPFGTITEMYSLPDPHSIDTNWAIGLFFFIFFGMMLSDAGYGIVLILGGFLGAKLLDISDGAVRFFRMIGICGISTVFWGAVYGSWFGDAIPTAAEMFFHRQIDIPYLIDPLSQPMTVLILACVLGIIHLFTGMGIKAYIMIKRGDRWGALFDVGFWYMLLTGLLMLVAPGMWKKAGYVLAIVGAAGLVFTQGRHKPKLAGKITAGVMSLYNITGYFSDVLSYSRILALGLATGVVASVVNIMASMAGNGITGIILFIIVFTAGHILNLGINALGAYVHSARLQYVEFFGKYYEGGGRKFEPLRIKTKYVRVTEDKK